MLAQAAQQLQQCALLGSAQATQDRFNLPFVALKHVLNQMPARVSQLHKLGPLIGGIVRAKNQARTFQAIHYTRYAWWPDQQAFAQCRDSESRQPFMLRSNQIAQHAPLRSADAVAGEVRLHRTFDATKSAQQFPKGAYRDRIRAAAGSAISRGHRSISELFSMLTNY